LLAHEENELTEWTLLNVGDSMDAMDSSRVVAADDDDDDVGYVGYVDTFWLLFLLTLRISLWQWMVLVMAWRRGRKGLWVHGLYYYYSSDWYVDVDERMCFEMNGCSLLLLKKHYC
jgi:hypothetical protein